MGKLKQASLFEDEEILLKEIRKRERKLKTLQQEAIELPAKLEKEKRERETTMPPNPDISERKRLKQFEESLSRGQIGNVLRTQRRSFAMMILLFTATCLMLLWAFRIYQGS